MERPSWLREEHLFYLDGLRESGATNMWGATPYIEDEFEIDHDMAGVILKYWMKSFSDRHPK